MFTSNIYWCQKTPFFFLLPFPLLFPIHFFLPYIATCCTTDTVTNIWFQLPSSPNTKYTSGTRVEGCWMSMEGCYLPQPPDRKRKKKEGWAQSCLALQKASNTFSSSGRCSCCSCSLCIIWHLNENLTNVSFNGKRGLVKITACSKIQ